MNYIITYNENVLQIRKREISRFKIISIFQVCLQKSFASRVKKYLLLPKCGQLNDTLLKIHHKFTAFAVISV